MVSLGVHLIKEEALCAPSSFYKLHLLYSITLEEHSETFSPPNSKGIGILGWEISILFSETFV